MTPPPRHLFTVWNPAYTDDALDAHLSILLEWTRKHQSGAAHADDVYVWWGKIRSRNREGMLPHHAEVLAIDAQCKDGTETHLYLSDYRSLYVAQVSEVTDDDIQKDEGESDHLPPYYEGHAADFWFRLFDIRRIIFDDTPAVIEELKKLKNTRYHDRPVSLYGGVVELPLIVFREPEAGWFADRDLLTEGRLWAERAAELRSDAERMSRELRENLFGRDLWAVLEPGTRSFLAAAEAVFRSRRADPGFDLSGAAVEYAKAVETELNTLIFPALQRAFRSKSSADRIVRTDKAQLDLGGIVPHQSLGTIHTLLSRQDMVQSGLRQQLRHDYGWVLGAMLPDLDKLVDLRNEGAHETVIGLDALESVRERVVGIGCEGMLARLARVKLRTRASS